MEIGWELYRSYLGVMHEGSLSGASRALGIAQPTVGRHIASLEKILGLSLFTRSQAGLLPTEAALALKPFADAMTASAAAFRREAECQVSGVQGTVRITASEIMGAEVLPPIITQLQSRYPALTVELVLANEVHDLLLREADIAVRMTQPRQDALVARRVGEIELGLHAHERYLQARGVPNDVEDLEHHSLIGFDEETLFIRTARQALPKWDREKFILRTDSDLAQLAMIRAGAGIGVCQIAIAKKTPELVRVLPQFRPVLNTWLIMHADLRKSPSCKATFDALFHGLHSYTN